MAYQSAPDRYLIISDLQMPFEHDNALEFYTDIVSHFRIPKENVYNVGDETDQYYGSLWNKDVNAEHTALSEISETKDRLRPWFELFPQMKLATSNHGTRWQRKALESSIPSILMRRYEEVLGCPEAWAWDKFWRVNCKFPFIVEHGDDYGGSFPHVTAAMHNAMSTAIGHHHSKSGVEHIQTNGFKIWAMVTGSMINFKKYAFHYARAAKLKPILSAGVVLDSGSFPLIIPYV